MHIYISKCQSDSVHAGDYKIHALLHIGVWRGQLAFSYPLISRNKRGSRTRKRNLETREFILMIKISYVCPNPRDGLIKIPQKKSMRDYLAMKHLIGKIRLTSDMNEGEIFQEIRSVFYGPMAI